MIINFFLCVTTSRSRTLSGCFTTDAQDTAALVKTFYECAEGLLRQSGQRNDCGPAWIDWSKPEQFVVTSVTILPSIPAQSDRPDQRSTPGAPPDSVADYMNPNTPVDALAAAAAGRAEANEWIAPDDLVRVDITIEGVQIINEDYEEACERYRTTTEVLGGNARKPKKPVYDDEGTIVMTFDHLLYLNYICRTSKSRDIFTRLRKVTKP